MEITITECSVSIIIEASFIKHLDGIAINRQVLFCKPVKVKDHFHSQWLCEEMAVRQPTFTGNGVTEVRCHSSSYLPSFDENWVFGAWKQREFLKSSRHKLHLNLGLVTVMNDLTTVSYLQSRNRQRYTNFLHRLPPSHQNRPLNNGRHLRFRVCHKPHRHNSIRYQLATLHTCVLQ